MNILLFQVSDVYFMSMVCGHPQRGGQAQRRGSKPWFTCEHLKWMTPDQEILCVEDLFAGDMKEKEAGASWALEC